MTLRLWACIRTCVFKHPFNLGDLVLFAEDVQPPHHFVECPRLKGEQHLSPEETRALNGRAVRDPATLERALKVFQIPEEIRGHVQAFLARRRTGAVDVMENSYRFHDLIDRIHAEAAEPVLNQFGFEVRRRRR